MGDATIDQCSDCQGLWFDATDLDRATPEPTAAAYPTLEASLPERGRATRHCPRCDIPLRTAGWDALVFDRCPTCRGIYLDRRDWQQLERGDVPATAVPFETSLRDFMLTAGWTLLHAKAVLLILSRFLRP